jgi:hypothetical protein
VPIPPHTQHGLAVSLHSNVRHPISSEICTCIAGMPKYGSAGISNATAVGNAVNATGFTAGAQGLTSGLSTVGQNAVRSANALTLNPLLNTFIDAGGLAPGASSQNSAFGRGIGKHEQE